MNIGGMPLLQALTDKMRWHQARQTVLAENIANAQTPNYTARDLKAFSLDGPAKGGLSMASVSFSANSPNHIAISSLGRTDGFAREETEGFEMGPGGNSVDLEDEMMKVAGNELDYQTATTLYTRSLRLIRTALGRTA